MFWGCPHPVAVCLQDRSDDGAASCWCMRCSRHVHREPGGGAPTRLDTHSRAGLHSHILQTSPDHSPYCKHRNNSDMAVTGVTVSLILLLLKNLTWNLHWNNFHFFLLLFLHWFPLLLSLHNEPSFIPPLLRSLLLHPFSLHLLLHQSEGLLLP